MPNNDHHDLRLYPDYRESRLPWLGAVPTHWDVRRNGRLFTQRAQTGFGDLPILEVSLNTGVRVRDLDNAKRKQVMSNRAKYKRAAKGDIAYNMMRLWQGAVGMAPVDGLVSPAYVVAWPFEEVDSRYYAYLFRTDAYMNEVNKYSRGIVTDRNRLYWDEFKQMPSPFPPTQEQRTIADFLDHHGQAARRFIRNRRRLIEVLNEQKQAIIDRAITRGLDSNVRLKPSGIDWLGEVPPHWEVVRLKRLLVINDGGVWGTTFSDDGVTVLRSTEQTVDGHWRIVQPAKRALSQSERSGALLAEGDLLVTKSSGSPAHIGKTTLVTADVAALDCCFSNFMQRLRVGSGVDPKFVWYVLNAPLARKQLQYMSSSTTGLGNLSGTILGNIWLAKPPSADVPRLITRLEIALRPFDQAILNARREIDLVNDYRTRLIADMVTGKVDVRHLMPDSVEASAEESEPWGEEEEQIEGEHAEDLEADEEVVHAD